MHELSWWIIVPTLVVAGGCNQIMGNEPPGPKPNGSSAGMTGGSSSTGGAGLGNAGGGNPNTAGSTGAGRAGSGSAGAGSSNTAGSSTAGAGLGGASGGSANTGGVAEPTTVGVIGSSCSPSGASACSGRNQRAQLTCLEGKWSSLGQCDSTERCDTRAGANAGMCESVVPECEDKEPGAAVEVCDGNSPSVCGVDRVSLASAAPCEPTFGCAAGACKPKLAECAGQAESTWVCATSGKERVQCGANETESGRQPCAGSCTGGFCDFPSCAELAPTCGAAANGDCCESLLVPGGSFLRGTDNAAPATVTTFRLDKYEVTVARFRAFRAAWEAGYRPALGAGKHGHLNLGRGLSDGNGAYEAGWDPAWEAQVNVADSGREGSYTTWTSSPGEHENLPLNYVSWFEGFAFCIWDGGFLPSETEWEYAAAGGSEERTYPWGTTAPDCDYANFSPDGDSCSGTSTHSEQVGSLPLGDGLWKHSDLAGNVREWCLDWDAPLPSQCSDCVQMATATLRSCRGGANAQNTDTLAAAARGAVTPTTRAATTGFRCARAPK